MDLVFNVRFKTQNIWFHNDLDNKIVRLWIIQNEIEIILRRQINLSEDYECLKYHKYLYAIILSFTLRYNNLCSCWPYKYYWGQNFKCFEIEELMKMIIQKGSQYFSNFVLKVCIKVRTIKHFYIIYSGENTSKSN